LKLKLKLILKSLALAPETDLN